MNNKLRNFMIGRYGIDELYKLLLIIYFILMLINIFMRNKIITIIELLLIIIIIYRVLSKNIKHRRKENEIYLKFKNKIISKYNYNKKKYKDRNTHMYKKCPKCSNKFEVKCHRNEKIKIEIIK